MLEEDHRIVVADRLNEQALRFVWRRGNDDLEAGDVGEHRVEALAVLAGGTETRAVHGADHHGCSRLAAEHVAEFGGLVENLVEADTHEINEHQVGDGAEASRGGAGGSAYERAFGDGCVQDAVAAEFGEQALGDAEGAAPGVVLTGGAGTPGDVFAHQHHCRIAVHFVTQGFVDGLAEGFLAHRASALSKRRTHRLGCRFRRVLQRIWRRVTRSRLQR